MSNSVVNGKQTICAIFEVVFDYSRLIRERLRRPLTGLEQRAFLYLLDVDEDTRFRHADPPECVCDEIFPGVVAALAPDPVDADASTRNLEDASHPAQRWHTERVGKHQGIVIGPKLQREHAKELQRLGRSQLDDFAAVVQELGRRGGDGSRSAARVLHDDFPRFVELAQALARRRRKPAVVQAPPAAKTLPTIDAGFLRSELAPVAFTRARWGL